MVARSGCPGGALTQLLLIRHASAGHRNAWGGDDRLRPLDDVGRAQAPALVPELERFAIQRVMTSPYVRCVETAEPLAAARRLPLEYRDELGDDADPAAARRLIGELAAEGATVALCVHGDLVRELLGEELEKGSVAVVDAASSGDLTRLETLAPPVRQ